jgi:hypothetical protein
MEIKMFGTEIDFIGDKNDAEFIGKQFGIKINILEGLSESIGQPIAWVSGPKSKVKNFLIEHHFGDKQEVEEIYFSN